MDYLQHLKTSIHQYDFRADDPNGKKAESILNLLDIALRTDKEEFRERAPPLDILVYALKSILYPTFLPELMSDFLHHFTMIEFYRIRATEKAAAAITWNDFYEGSRDQGIPLLTDDDKEYFQHIIDSDEEMRKIFTNVVTTCCLIDLQRLWLGQSNTDFWVRWNEYLSVLRRPEDRKTSHSFHHNLSDKEIVALRDTAIQCSYFMAATTQWAEGERQDGQSIQEVFRMKAFLEQFPTPEITPKLHKAIIYHLDYVLEVVQRLVSNDGEKSST